MTIIVQKYGGSSVADVNKIKGVAKKIAKTRDSGADVVAVVSAMGKTTDQLLSLAKDVVSEPPRRELDMLLSTGERITMALLSMAVQELGYDAISFTGSQSGIITNDRHFDAKIIDVRPHRIEDELSRGRVVIIAGYQGMSYKREITTLGRGGSDTTAIAMAAALGAKRAEIYSDVDGVYSSDPRIVEEAEHLPELSYDEMLTMSASGAKVLHSKAVEFAIERGIAIHALSTFGESGRHTRIHGGATPREVTAVVGRKGLVSARFDTPQSALLALAEQNAHIASVGSGGLLLDPNRSEHWSRTQEWLNRESAPKAVGTVTIVGRRSDLVSACLKAAGDIDVLAIDSQGTGVQLTVNESDVDELTRRAHSALIGAGA